MRRRFVLASALLVLLAAGAAYAGLGAFQASGCPPVLSGRVVRTQLTPATFGAVTTYSLPAGRLPNAIAVAPDGSVWFGEEAVPALAHLFPSNGTLVQYPLPGAYPPSSSIGYDCADRTDVWGVALWDGRVWASDTSQNRLVGLAPTNASFKVVPLAVADSQPYTLTPGPNGALWFTQVHSGQIGELFPNGTLVEHPVQVPELLNGTPTPVYVPGVPAQVAFANSTAGYYVDASPLIDGSPLFSFDPAQFHPAQVGGGNVSLPDPDSLSLGAGGIWLAEHGDSGLARYAPQTGSWSVFPTSPVAYIATTLPYFVEVNGSLVWFNEHFANRMAVLDSANMTLTEYSLSDPPAGNLSQITNALTFAVGGGRAWFAESTASAVGFVNASYRPAFSISANETSISLPRGGGANIEVEVEGRSSSPLTINVSGWDSPSPTDANITARPSEGDLQTLAGSQTVQVAVQVGPSTPPGSYTALVTVSDGLVSRSVYVQLSVLP